FHCRAQRTEFCSQCVQRVVRVETARIRQYPDLGSSERIRLPAHGRPGPGKCRAIGTQAEYREDPRTVLVHSLGEVAATVAQFLRGQLRGLRRRAGYDIGDTQTQLE